MHPIELSKLAQFLAMIGFFWSGIKSNPSQTVRAQKQIPALHYMNRNYKLDKNTTQRLLDLAMVRRHKLVDS